MSVILHTGGFSRGIVELAISLDRLNLRTRVPIPPVIDVSVIPSSLLRGDGRQRQSLEACESALLLL